MLLAIDVGNTRIKGAVYERNTLINQFVFSSVEVKNNIENILEKNPKITDLIVSSVGNENSIVFNSFSERISIHFVSHQDIFPFQNKYATPTTLGIDRMVLASGATLLFPKKNKLVIDAGTCVTYDFIDDENRYWGGAISPGLRLRYESLHQFTAKLPLLTLEEPLNFIGNSTNQSIHSGVVNGLIHEIDGFIEQYKNKNENFTIILTGGDAEFLAKRLKNTIFANSNFLLESLNQFFQYKINND
ncbi:MAG TPA: type III pantothenate kinase [Flavobacterium sp.]|jgi:type III pantothenate kinase|nr:type III pantothenate kinase [Flavobacterium sp.]HQV34697.1 type III pantothenate kinase [Flavobacterium sp.]HQX03079.1 type III pantothenate kinase [Flavobacterium sp.]HRZ30805.1 type III pantothenate kinase [Flavobacterium sp.]HRZ73492.1 type III pantothenate kinase [Flavobacterium sp.]